MWPTFSIVVLHLLFGLTLEINMWYVIINIVLTSGMGSYFLIIVKKYESKTLYYLTMVKWNIFRYILIIFLVNTGIISAACIEGFTVLNLVNVIGYTFIITDIPQIITKIINDKITPFIPSIVGNLVSTNILNFKDYFNLHNLDFSNLNRHKVTIGG